MVELFKKILQEFFDFCKVTTLLYLCNPKRLKTVIDM